MIESLICPNCSAPLDPSMAKGNIIVCPYCAHKMMLGGTEITASVPVDEGDDDEVVATQTFYKPNLTSDDFESICQKLFDEDPLLPDDIFHEVNFRDVKHVFLPTVLVHGSCKGTLTYTDSAGKYCTKDVGKTFSHRALSNKSNVVPGDIAQKMSAFDFSPSHEADTMSYDDFMNGYGESTGFTIDKTECNYSTIENDVITKTNTELIKANTSSSDKDIKHNIKYYFDDFDETEAYIPCFIIAFKYKTEEYHILCDAVDGSLLIHHLPEDKERRELLKSTVSTPAAFAMLAILIIPPLLWIFGPLKFGTLLLLAIPATIALIIIFYFDSKKLEAKKQQAVEEARLARKQ